MCWLRKHIMINNNNPVARQIGLVVQEMSNEVLIYDFDRDKSHCQNESAAFVCRISDGTRSFSDIVQEFENQGIGKVSDDFVWLALDQLAEKSLLQYEIKPKFKGHSRRQVIKTI